MATDDCKDNDHCNWRPFDFNFEPQNLWSNLAFYSANLLSLVVLLAFSHKIKANDFIKSYVVMSIYAPACLMVFAILFTINRLTDAIYVHSLVMDTVCKIFNGIAKTTFLISSGAVIILAIYVAIKRRPIGLGVAWGPFCCTVVFAVVWLFFFANRLHLYFLIADGCLLILALCVFLCCSDYRFGTPVDRQLGDARSRLFWTTCFVVVFLAFYACVEIFYPPKGAPFLLNQLRGLQYVFLMIGVVLLLPPYRDILFCRKEPMRPEEDPSYMRNTESSPLPPTPPSAPPMDPPSYQSNPGAYPSYSYSYPPPSQPYPVMVHASSTIRITPTPIIQPGVILHPSHSYPQVSGHGGYFYVHG